MKLKDYIKKFVNITQNKEPFKIDLKNGVILDMIYDEEVENYRAYMKEENVCVGIWDIKFILECLADENYDEFEIIL